MYSLFDNAVDCKKLGLNAYGILIHGHAYPTFHTIFNSRNERAELIHVGIKDVSSTEILTYHYIGGKVASEADDIIHTSL